MYLPEAIRMITFAMLGVAWLIVFLTPEYGPVWVVAGALVLAAAWFSRGRWLRGRNGARLWRAAAALVILGLPVDMFVITQSLLHPALHVALVTQTLLILDEPTARRHRLLVILSFFCVLAGTQLTQALVFAPFFLLYTGLMIVVLTLLHLLDSARDAGIAFDRETDASRFHAVGALARVMVGAGAVVVPLVVLLFITLPRGRFSVIARPAPVNQAVDNLQQMERARKRTGFSSQVELGDYGRVQEDPTVVMRVRFPNGLPESVRRGSRYWRAGAMSVFDGWAWSTPQTEFPFYQYVSAQRSSWVWAQNRGRVMATFGSTFLLSRAFEGRAVSTLADVRALPELIEQEVFLELPFADNVIGLAPLAAISGPFPSGLWRDLNGGFRVARRQVLAEKLNYSVFSAAEPSNLESVGDVPVGAYASLMRHQYWGPYFRAHYLQLPDNMSAEALALVEELTAGEERIAGRITRLMEHLQGFTYSLDTQRPQLQLVPLDDFLFVSREGYCEHFATAMTVMLRAAGIPARLAHGFKGGVWNAPGQFFAVRQADAHTWVEAFVPDVGWVSLDPVPGGGGADTDSTAQDEPWYVPGENQYLLYARAMWQEQVLGYNQGNQSRAFTLAWQWVRRQPGRLWGMLATIVGAITAALVWTFAWVARVAPVLLPVVLGVLMYVVYVWRTGLPGGTVPIPGAKAPLVPFYARMLGVLKRAGYRKRATDPPRAFATRVTTARPELAGEVWELTRLYERVRFAREGLSRDEAAQVRAALRRLRRAGRAPESAGV